jgi:hypothetical protein
MDEVGVDQTRQKNGKDERKHDELLFMIFEDAADGEKW